MIPPPRPAARLAAALAVTLVLAAVAVTPVQAATADALSVRPLFTLDGFAPGRPYVSPEALLVNEADRALYVADSGDRQVGVSSLQGVPGFAIEAGRGFQPLSLATMADGRLLVSDGSTGGIKVLSPAGKLQAELDLAQLSGIEGARAGRLTVDRKGSLYCVDRAHGEILVFTFPWQLRLRLGTHETRERFKVPEDVAVDSFGRIYVSDSLGVPIQVFDSGGTFVFSIGHHGDGASEMSSPTSLHMDRFDQLWVTDTLRNQVVIFDRSGWPLRVFGEFGQRQGQLFHPVDLGLDGLGRIYVAEREGRRVQVFSYDHPLDRFSK